MKIFIAGSMQFAKQMLEAKELLESFGYESFISPDTYACLENPDLNMDDKHNFSNDIMKACMDIQEKCDAIIVLNYTKDDIEGYIGAHSLIELGLAYYLKQKIFLLYPVLPQEQIRSSQEILHMRPKILNGNLANIKEYTI